MQLLQIFLSHILFISKIIKILVESWKQCHLMKRVWMQLYLFFWMHWLRLQKMLWYWLVFNLYPLISVWIVFNRRFLLRHKFFWKLMQPIVVSFITLQILLPLFIYLTFKHCYWSKYLTTILIISVVHTYFELSMALVHEFNHCFCMIYLVQCILIMLAFSKIFQVKKSNIIFAEARVTQSSIFMIFEKFHSMAFGSNDRTNRLWNLKLTSSLSNRNLHWNLFLWENFQINEKCTSSLFGHLFFFKFN